MIQTNLRQIDFEDIDAQEYVRQLKSFHATVALINVGGILANYPSRVADHPINPYLKGDSLEQIIDACHRSGIRVIARVDYSKIRREVFQHHPEWAYRTPQGEIVDYNGNVHACICGGFQQEKSFEITQEILHSFPIDGLFINMGGFTVKDYSYRYYGICHCESCQRRFRERFGLQLPEKEDIQDIVYRKYRVFQEEVKRDYKQRMEQFIHLQNPNIAVDTSDFIRLESNTEYRRMHWQYESSSTVRGQQSLSRGLPCSNPTVDFVGYFYRHVAVSPPMQALRLWQTIANLGKLDYYIMSRLDNHQDKSGYGAVKRAFAFHKEHFPEFSGMKLTADALLVRKGGYAASPEGRGWVRAFTENHILLHEAEPEMVADLEELRKYRVILLADAEMLEDKTVQLLDDYVALGGCLIVMGAAGQYGDAGAERAHLPFASLGCPRIVTQHSDMLSAMLKLKETDHALFPKMEDSELFFFGERFVYAEYDAQTIKSLNLIPPHHYGPPELCYYTEVTQLPGLALRFFGKGKTVHIPWYPGTLYYQEGYHNTFAFMHGVLTQIGGLKGVEAAPFSPMVEVTVAENDEGSRIIQLVNGTGCFGNSFFDPVPIHGICLRIPGRGSKARTLNGGISYLADKNGTLEITLDVLNDYEAIIVEKEEQK